MSNNSNNTTPQAAAGDFSRALRGEIKLTVGPLLKRSWDITLRSLPWMFFVLIGLATLGFVVSEIITSIVPFSDSEIPEPQNTTWDQLNLGSLTVSGLLQELVLAPFSALLIYIGIVNAIDKKPNIAGLSRVLHFAPNLILVSITKMLLTILLFVTFISASDFVGGTIAILLLLLMLVIVQLVFIFASPLIIDRELTAFRALTASFLVVKKAIFPVLGFMSLVFLIALIALVPLVIILTLLSLPVYFIAVLSLSDDAAAFIAAVVVLVVGCTIFVSFLFNAIGVLYNSLIGIDEQII